MASGLVMKCCEAMLEAWDGGGNGKAPARKLDTQRLEEAASVADEALALYQGKIASDLATSSL